MGLVSTDRGCTAGSGGEVLRLPLDAHQPLDLEITFTCGQIFRWRREGEWWCGTLGETALAVRQSGDDLEVRQAGGPLGLGELARVLALDHDLPRIYRRIGPDRAIRAAIAALPGLRVLRQDPW